MNADDISGIGKSETPQFSHTEGVEDLPPKAQLKPQDSIYEGGPTLQELEEYGISFDPEHPELLKPNEVAQEILMKIIQSITELSFQFQVLKKDDQEKYAEIRKAFLQAATKCVKYQLQEAERQEKKITRRNKLKKIASYVAFGFSIVISCIVAFENPAFAAVMLTTSITFFILSEAKAFEKLDKGLDVTLGGGKENQASRWAKFGVKTAIILGAVIASIALSGGSSAIFSALKLGEKLGTSAIMGIIISTGSQAFLNSGITDQISKAEVELLVKDKSKKEDFIKVLNIITMVLVSALACLATFAAAGGLKEAKKIFSSIFNKLKGVAQKAESAAEQAAEINKMINTLRKLKFAAHSSAQLSNDATQIMFKTWQSVLNFQLANMVDKQAELNFLETVINLLLRMLSTLSKEELEQLKEVPNSISDAQLEITDYYQTLRTVAPEGPA